jgi:hypothetical protein
MSHAISMSETVKFALILEGCLATAPAKFAISASLDAAPAVVKAARRSPLMLAARLTREAVGEILRARKPPLQSANSGRG